MPGITRTQSANSFKPSEEVDTVVEASSRLESLLTYPSLARLFDDDEPRRLAEVRGRLLQTHRDLERLIRQGSREEATSAESVAKAYDLTLKLLAELEEVKGAR